MLKYVHGSSQPRKLNTRNLYYSVYLAQPKFTVACFVCSHTSGRLGCRSRVIFNQEAGFQIPRDHYQPVAISSDCEAPKANKKREYLPSFSPLQRTGHDHCVVPARIIILHHLLPPCPSFSILCTRLRRKFARLILMVNKFSCV